MKTFLKPLSAKEEAEYLAILHGDNKEAANHARQVLIERNLRLVAHVAKKYAGVREEPEDLISVGTIGLMKGIMTYEPHKGSRLATYAARCIDNELLMMFRAKKKLFLEISLYEPIGTDKEGNEIQILDVCEQEQIDIVDRLDHQEKLRQLAGAMKCLNPREYEIIARRFGLFGQEEMTQQEIGEHLDISRSYVSRIEKRAIEKLRKEMKIE